MSIIREDDPRWWTVLAIIAVIVGLALAILHAETHGVTIKGKLFVGDEDCSFYTQPEGESESITLSVLPGWYLCDYLKGSQSRPVTITIVPQ